MAGKYAQFEQYVLFFEDFCFITSLYEFLNEKNEVKNSLFNGHIEFEFSYSYFKNNFLRKLEFYAKNSCGVVCQSDNECDGHKTLKYLQRYEQFMIHMVEEEKIFYKNMYVVKDGKNRGHDGLYFYTEGHGKFKKQKLVSTDGSFKLIFY